MNASRRLLRAQQPARLLDVLSQHEPCSAHTLTQAMALAGRPRAPADIAFTFDLLALRGWVVSAPGANAQGCLYALTAQGRRVCPLKRRSAGAGVVSLPNKRARWLALAPAVLLATSCTHWPETADAPVRQLQAKPALPATHGVMQRERAGELIFEGCPSQGCPQPTLKTRPAAMAPSPVLASAPLPGDRAASSGSQGAPVPGVAVFFGTGKARIDAGSLALLDGVASNASGSTWRLKVTGRTDSRGAPAVNARLAEARARAVARHLQRRGIDAQRIAIATDIREDSSLRDGVRAAAVPPDAQARARRAEISVERA